MHLNFLQGVIDRWVEDAATSQLLPVSSRGERLYDGDYAECVTTRKYREDQIDVPLPYPMPCARIGKTISLEAAWIVGIQACCATSKAGYGSRQGNQEIIPLDSTRLYRLMRALPRADTLKCRRVGSSVEEWLARGVSQARNRCIEHQKGAAKITLD